MPVWNGLQPSLGLRSTRGPRPRSTWARVLAQTRDAGSAGPLPPDSLFKAVRGRERPAAVEQARSAEVVAPQTQAALPRPVSDCCILSTHYACRDDPLTTRPWDGQTDTRLSCCRQAHPVHPHPLGREGAPGEPRVLEGGAGNGASWGRATQEASNAGDPPHVARGRPPHPARPRPPGAHQLHASIDEF